MVLTLESPEKVFNSYFPKSKSFTLKQYADLLDLKYRNLYKELKEINYLDPYNKPQKELVSAGYFLKGEIEPVIQNGQLVNAHCKPRITNLGVKHLSKMISSDPKLLKRLSK